MNLEGTLVYLCGEESSQDHDGNLTPQFNAYLITDNNISNNAQSLTDMHNVSVSENEEQEQDTNQEETKLWTNETILLYLDEVKIHYNEFNTTLRKYVWNKISKNIAAKLNKSITVGQLETKWKSMKRTYKSVLDNNNSSGKKRKQWEYFSLMHNILFDKPEITPVATCSNLKGLTTQAEPEAGTSYASDEDTENEAFRSNINMKRKRKMNTAEQRHKEKIQRQDKFLQLFEKLVEKF